MHKGTWRHLVRLCVALCAVIGPCWPTDALASTFVPLTFDELTARASIVVLGRVVAVHEVAAGANRMQDVVVHAGPALKGVLDRPEFTVRIWYAGLKGFDPKLRAGQSAVFFLASVESGRATLAYPAGLALFTRPFTAR